MDNVIYTNNSMSKKINNKLSNIIDLSVDNDTVLIEGEISNIDERETNSGKFIVIFDLYDGTSSITCKVFIQHDQINNIKEKLKNVKCVKVNGNVLLDPYDKELIVIANDITESTRTIREVKRDRANVKRVELHIHTKMSQMDGINYCKDYIDKAKEYGMTSLAITDHAVVQAFPEAQEYLEKIGDNEFKVLYGMEGYYSPNNNVKDKSYHISILVKNKTGLRNLYKIVSISNLDYFYKRPIILKEVLDENREGLLIGSACNMGELQQAIIKNKTDDELEQIANNYDYLEIQPLGNNYELIREGIVKDEKALEDINIKIVELGSRLNKLVVATSDTHFLNKEDDIYRKILQAGQGYEYADEQAPLYFRTTEEMLNEFEYLGKEKAYEVVVTNTNKISDMCDKIKPISDEKCDPYLPNSDIELKKLAYERANKIYGDSLPKDVEERLNKELNSIIDNGYSYLYMIFQKLVAKSNEDGYIVGSRGAVGSSLVAYLIGITEVDPIKYNIPFETFAGFYGIREPDIDLNVSGEYQITAQKYVKNIIEGSTTYKAGTIGTIADRSALEYVKKYYEERNIPVNKAEITRLARGCIEIKRTTGQHPGGIIVVPKGREIYEFTPVQHPADDPNSDIVTTHFDYHSIGVNLLKLDILGHDDPTMLKMLFDITGIDPTKVPLDDKETMSIFTGTEALGVTSEQINLEVGTYGVPEFGTKFVRSMLVEAKPTTFDELVKISGLAHGTDTWLYNAQDLINEGIIELKDTISTRDDIMIYLMQKGLPVEQAFRIMETVRKGKALKDLDKWNEFKEIMKQYDVPNWYIESCEKIKYLFPKAHSVGYVINAFRIAWYKVHKPKAFYAAHFTIRANWSNELKQILVQNEKQLLIDKIQELENREFNDITIEEHNLKYDLQIALEMYERGIKFLPADLEKSDSTKCLVEEAGIRLPLIVIE